MKTKTLLIALAILIIALFGVQKIVTNTHNAKPHILDALAQCIKDSGAKFYGHYQCSHCKNQKNLFDTAQKNLPYIECGILGRSMGDGQADVCENLTIPGLPRIQGYPTWVFADNSVETGEMSVAKLAEKTSCSVPAEYVAPESDEPAITVTPVTEPVSTTTPSPTESVQTGEVVPTATITPAKN